MLGKAAARIAPRQTKRSEPGANHWQGFSSDPDRERERDAGPCDRLTPALAGEPVDQQHDGGHHDDQLQALMIHAPRNELSRAERAADRHQQRNRRTCAPQQQACCEREEAKEQQEIERWDHQRRGDDGVALSQHRRQSKRDQGDRHIRQARPMHQGPVGRIHSVLGEVAPRLARQQVLHLDQAHEIVAVPTGARPGLRCQDSAHRSRRDQPDDDDQLAILCDCHSVLGFGLGPPTPAVTRIGAGSLLGH